YQPDLAVLDLSFISLSKVLGAVLDCLAPRYDALALVKPQFEVGRGRGGKGGGVRDPDQRRAALIGVGQAAVELGAAVLGYHSSGLPGPKGNRETFVWLASPEQALATPPHPGAVLPAPGRGAAYEAELDRLAREVEP
ncbi:MAG TPA: SAM-dependent methyltransferase, partial [Solirubrobacteraceae bacterium]|nr:SAM-dependent methyltransferase [Solirubrobacteraceae bacterium]